MSFTKVEVFCNKWFKKGLNGTILTSSKIDMSSNKCLISLCSVKNTARAHTKKRQPSFIRILILFLYIRCGMESETMSAPVI